MATSKIFIPKTIEEITRDLNMDYVCLSHILSTCDINQFFKLQDKLTVYNYTFTPLDFRWAIMNPNCTITTKLMELGVKPHSTSLYDLVRHNKQYLFDRLVKEVPITYACCTGILKYDNVSMSVRIKTLRYYDYHLTEDEEYLESLVVKYDDAGLFKTLIDIGHRISSSELIKGCVKDCKAGITNYILSNYECYREEPELIRIAIGINDKSLRVKMIRLLVSWNIPIAKKEIYDKVDKNDIELMELLY